jgi:hypothetical protein
VKIKIRQLQKFPTLHKLGLRKYLKNKYIHAINKHRKKKEQLCTVAAVEISDRKDLNTLYKFRNLISVNRIFIKVYKVSVSF